MTRETMGFRRSGAQVMRPVRPRPPMVAAYQSGFSVGEQRRRVPSERTSSKRDVAAEGAGDVVVLAVDVVGDGAAEGDVFGSGRDGQEEAARDGEVEDLRERDAGLGGEKAGLGVEVDQAVHAGGEQQIAVLEQADVAIAAAQSDGQRAVVQAAAAGGKSLCQCSGTTLASYSDSGPRIRRRTCAVWSFGADDMSIRIREQRCGDLRFESESLRRQRPHTTPLS